MVKIFSHINKRIKSISNIRLPCKEIIRVVLGQQGEKKKSVTSTSTSVSEKNSTVSRTDEDAVMKDSDELDEEEENEEDDETDSGIAAVSSSLPPSNPVRTNFGMV